jgi:hypothetical protein
MFVKDGASNNSTGLMMSHSSNERCGSDYDRFELKKFTRSNNGRVN